MSLVDTFLRTLVNESDIADAIPQLEVKLREALAATEKASAEVTAVIGLWRALLAEAEPVLAAAGVKIQQ